jgi:cytochrome c553
MKPWGSNRKAVPCSAAAAVLALLVGLGGMPGQHAFAATPDTDTAATIVHRGSGAAVPACSACHGDHGQGQAKSDFPRLAGLNAAYLLRQLDDFANRTRKNAVMTPIASALSAPERKALAHYYSKLPVATLSPAPAASSSSASDRLGKRLAIRGRWSKQVPGCVKCHGPKGVGVGANFPPLAGQPAKYIASQLRAFQNGSRHNDPMGLMRHVASALNEQDIRAVSQWFAKQPDTLPGRRP